MAENQKVKSLFEIFIRGSQGRFCLDFTPCFQIYGLFIFQHFLKKWTFDCIFGLLETEKSKTKLWDFTDETTVRIESNENKS